MSSLPQFETYDAIEAAMWDLVEQKFLKGTFLRTLAQGRYTLVQLQYFAMQYAYYSRHFPRVLGAAISAMEADDEWWLPLADNLWDEAGRGQPGQSHQRLYLTFLRSVHPSISLDGRGLPPVPMSRSIGIAVEEFIQFFRTCEPLEAMAAVGLGSEMFAGTVMGAIGEGFRHPLFGQWVRTDTRFWDLHASDHEPRHYQLCKDVLSRYTSSDALQRMYAAGSRIALSEARMYEGLHAEMVGLTE